MIECGLRGELVEGRRHAEGRIPTAHVRMPLADASPQAAQRARQALEAVGAS